MKQGKIFGFIISIINIILIAVCLFFSLRSDRTAPELHFEDNDITYTSGMKEETLLEGITAFDSNDGSITEKIVIEKMIENKDDNKLVVFYAVSDEAGNVTKASREFDAIFMKETDDHSIQKITEAGIDAELSVKVGEASDSEQEVVEQSHSTQTAPPTATPVSEPTPTSVASPTPEVNSLPEESTSPENQEEVVPEEPITEPVVEPASAAPILALNTSQVTIPKGVAPAWVSLVSTLSDDVDNYETLFQNITVSAYDINTEGTYQVTVSTRDSDGNSSQAVPLTIIVDSAVE